MGKKIVRVESLKNQRVISEKCYVAEDFFTRLRGLIGKRGLEPSSGLMFPKCKSVHMWFMRFSIDVVFLRPHDEDPSKYIVSSLHRNIRPWRIFPVSDFKARDVLELPDGSIESHSMSTGDQLCIS